MKKNTLKLSKLNPAEREEIYRVLSQGTKLTASKSTNKGWIDTPLFLSVEEQKQLKLF